MMDDSLIIYLRYFSFLIPLLIFAVIAIAFFIARAIFLRFASSRLRPMTTDDLEDIAEQVAEKMVTAYMSDDEIYKKNTNVMKAAPLKDIRAKTSEILPLLLDPSYRDFLMSRGLLEDDMFRKRDMPFIIADTVHYVITENDKQIRSFEKRMTKKGITPEQFFAYADTRRKKVSGIYILYDRTHGKYYVGQAKNIVSRAKKHFTGTGSPGVYSAYQQGAQFLIMIQPLNGSRFSSLDEQEAYYIKKLGAYENGYNENRGNSYYTK